MVKVLFEQEAKLSTTITYDITAWSIPYAYGLHGFSSETSLAKFKNTPIENSIISNEINKNAYAYLNKWNEVSDAAFLGDLLEAKFNVYFSNFNFSVEGNNYKEGTLIIMRGENTHIPNFDEMLVEIANKLNKKLFIKG